MNLPERQPGRRTEGSCLLDLVMARGECAAHSMADLVVCHQGLALAVRHGRALHAGHDAVHAVIDLRQRDGALGAPACQDGSLHRDGSLRCRNHPSSLSTLNGQKAWPGQQSGLTTIRSCVCRQFGPHGKSWWCSCYSLTSQYCFETARAMYHTSVQSNLGCPKQVRSKASAQVRASPH